MSRQDSFAKHVLTMLLGSSIAQAIPIFLSPILTRLYSPEDFALVGLYVSLFGPLSVVSTGRYSLAVMLPDGDEEAGDVVALTMIISVVVSVICLLAVIMFGDRLVARLANPRIAPWLLALPVSVLAMALFEALNYWSNRKSAYRQIAAANVVQQIVAGTVGLCVGLAGGLGWGLVAATVSGHTATLGVMAWGVRRSHPVPLTHTTRERLAAVAREYRAFPLYKVPYSLIGNFSRGFMIIALTAFNHVAAAGYLHVGRRLMQAPVYLLSASLGQVYFQRAARTFGTPGLEILTNRLLGAIAMLGTPVYVFVAWWAPEIFGVVFGPDWYEGGRYATAFLPVAVAVLFTSWPSRMYEVAGRQRLSLGIQVVSDGLAIALVWGLLVAEVAPLTCVWVYSLSYVGYHATYLLVIFHIAGFAQRGLAVLLARVLACGAGALGVLVLLEQLQLPRLLQFMVGGTAVAGFTAWSAKNFWRLKGMAAEPADS